MIELIELRRPDWESLCRKHGVKSLEVFGSVADGTWDPCRSDLDFLVEILPLPPAQLAPDYFGLLREPLEGIRRACDFLLTVTVGRTLDDYRTDETCLCREAKSKRCCRPVKAREGKAKGMANFHGFADQFQ
jgi:predicted nucleotidyltransferase